MTIDIFRQRIASMRHNLRRSPLSGQAAQQGRGAADCGEYCQATGVAAMSELLQFIIVVGFGARSASAAATSLPSS
jgi:hypothetical protein